MPRRKIYFRLQGPYEGDKEIVIDGPAREDPFTIRVDFDDVCSDYAWLAAERMACILNDHWAEYGPVPVCTEREED